MAKNINKGAKEPIKDTKTVLGSTEKKEANAPTFVFNKENYILLGVGLALIVIGLMFLMEALPS